MRPLARPPPRTCPAPSHPAPPSPCTWCEFSSEMVGRELWWARGGGGRGRAAWGAGSKSVRDPFPRRTPHTGMKMGVRDLCAPLVLKSGRSELGGDGAILSPVVSSRGWGGLRPKMLDFSRGRPEKGPRKRGHTHGKRSARWHTPLPASAQGGPNTHPCPGRPQTPRRPGGEGGRPLRSHFPWGGVGGEGSLVGSYRPPKSRAQAPGPSPIPGFPSQSVVFGYFHISRLLYTRDWGLRPGGGPCARRRARF